MEWHKMYYNGLETNIECTKNGIVKRLKVDWARQEFAKIGEVDFSNLIDSKGYDRLGILVKGVGRKCIRHHQIIAATFLDYKFGQNLWQVDHIDNNKKNNSLVNLQLLDNRSNTTKSWSNRKKNNLPCGVLKRKSGNYEAQIFFNGKKHNLGTYKNIEDASNAYKNKLKEIKSI